jgi:hypothetical protein
MMAANTVLTDLIQATDAAYARTNPPWNVDSEHTVRDGAGNVVATCENEADAAMIALLYQNWHRISLALLGAMLMTQQIKTSIHNNARPSGLDPAP